MQTVRRRQGVSQCDSPGAQPAAACVSGLTQARQGKDEATDGDSNEGDVVTWEYKAQIKQTNLDADLEVQRQKIETLRDIRCFWASKAAEQLCVPKSKVCACNHMQDMGSHSFVEI